MKLKIVRNARKKSRMVRDDVKGKYCRWIVTDSELQEGENSRKCVKMKIVRDATKESRMVKDNVKEK